jgi:hypothetical protein
MLNGRGGRVDPKSQPAHDGEDKNLLFLGFKSCIVWPAALPLYYTDHGSSNPLNNEHIFEMQNSRRTLSAVVLIQV